MEIGDAEFVVIIMEGSVKDKYEGRIEDSEVSSSILLCGILLHMQLLC